MMELHLKICGSYDGITFKNMWCSWLSQPKRFLTPGPTEQQLLRDFEDDKITEIRNVHTQTHF